MDKAILQLVMSTRTISERELVLFYTQNQPTTEAIEQVESLIGEINVKLLPLNYEIKRHKDKSVTGNNELCYSFINLLEDEPSKLHTWLSPEEAKTVTKLISICQENGEVPSSEALKIYIEITGSSMAVGQRMLRGMVEDGWLVESMGKYSLGPRSVEIVA